MKKKYIFFFLIFALSLYFIPCNKSYAATVGFTVRKISDYEWFTQLILYDFVDWVDDVSSDFTNGTIDRTMSFSTYQECIDWINNLVNVNGSVYANYVVPNGRIVYLNSVDNYYYQVAIPHRNFTTTIDSYDSYDDFINPPQPPIELTWYESLFSDFVSALGSAITGGIDGFLDWLEDAWTIPVGEGEDELALDLITPSPTPTPLPTPTPIPYTTTLVPDGNGGFNITYNYINPSGIPTSAPQPPTNEPQPTQSITINNGDEYPYYENPINKDDPYELDIPWYLKFTFKGTSTSLNDFQVGMDAVVNTVNDNDENISVVMDSVGLFPSDWLLLIGFIGSIPLIGGLISRLLKG